MLFCSIDASESSRLARYVNDEPKRTANCFTKHISVDNKPHVVIIAARNINENEAIRYDYGGDSRNLPWRVVSNKLIHAYYFII